MNKTLVKFAFAFLLLGLPAHTFAALIDSPTRPRMSEVLAEHRRYEPEYGIPYGQSGLHWEHYLNVIRRDAPQFIAQLEAAYPGATFAFMGRDTQTLADITEAVYLSIGQKNRVVQLGVSKPTLVGLSTGQILNYLEYFGFVVRKFHRRPPFILIDTVSKGEVINGEIFSGRQGRALLEAVYSYVAAINPAEIPALLEKFNMVGLRVSTFDKTTPGNVRRYSGIESLEQIRLHNARLVPTLPAGYGAFGANIMVPMIRDSSAKFNEAGYDHFTGAWHDRFQPPIDQGGQMLPNPGALTDPHIRASILWFQHKMIEIVNDPEFRERLRNEFKARSLNLEVPESSLLPSCNSLLSKG